LHIFEFSRHFPEEAKMPEQPTILGGRSTSTSARTAASGSAQAISRARIVAPAHKEESLSKAKATAEDWYLQLRGKLRAGGIKSEKTFGEVSEHYLREYDIITQGQRNKRYVDGQHWRCRERLVPFFGNLGTSEITAGKIQDYRIYRHQEAIAKRGKPPGHSTMHQEIVTLRQVLKTALRHAWLDRPPDFSEPYRSSPKISHRAWFSPEEYNELDTATRQRAKEPEKRGFKWEANSFTTMCFLQSIPECDPTRPGA
jgi:hypothetical protein